MDGNSGGTPSPFNNNTNSEPEDFSASADTFDAEAENYNAETTDYSPEPSPEMNSEFNPDAEYNTEAGAVDYDDSVSTFSAEYTETEPASDEIGSETTFTETNRNSETSSEEPLSSQMPDIPVKEQSDLGKPAVTSSTSRMPDIPSAGSARIPHSRARTMDSVIRNSANAPVKSSVPSDSLNFSRPMPVPVAGEANYANTNGVSSNNFNNPQAGFNGYPNGQAPIPPVAATDNLVASDSIVGPAKKKTGLIIGIILLIIALGCGIAAAIILLMPKADDRVEKAITRLINGQTPSNIMATGKITLASSNPTESDISALTINVDSKLATAQGAGESNFGITATLADSREIELTVDEVHNESGDLYLKIDGLTSVVNAMVPVTTTEEIDIIDSTNAAEVIDTTNCVAGSPEINSVNCQLKAPDSETFSMLSGVFDVIDNEWLRIPSETLSELSSEESLTLGGMTGLTLGDNPSQCLVSVMTNLGGYGNEVGKIYQQYPFVTYSTDQLKIAKKKDALYRLGLNETNFASFLNSLTSTRMTNDLLSCVGLSTATQNVSLATIQEIFAGTPVVYAEVDDNYNFTRIYFDGTVKDTTTSVTDDDSITATTGSSSLNIAADFTISYPTAPISITEPGDYIDVQEALQQILTQMFGEIMTLEE